METKENPLTTPKDINTKERMENAKIVSAYGGDSDSASDKIGQDNILDIKEEINTDFLEFSDEKNEPECMVINLCKTELLISDESSVNSDPFSEQNCIEDLESLEGSGQKIAENSSLLQDRCMYSCSLCTKKFTASSSLNRHMKLHSGFKQFSCNVCGKAFAHKSTLEYHLNTHSDVKPFTCNQCDKSFINKINLKWHVNTHTGYKPYSCKSCGKCFTRQPSLRRHRDKNCCEKPYECEYCSKAFSQKNNLRRHLKNHTGKKLYSCHEDG